MLMVTAALFLRGMLGQRGGSVTLVAGVTTGAPAPAVQTPAMVQVHGHGSCAAFALNRYSRIVLGPILYRMYP